MDLVNAESSQLKMCNVWLVNVLKDKGCYYRLFHLLKMKRSILL